MARFILFAATPFTLALLACGTNPTPTPVPSYSAIDGNWNIVGTEAAAGNPLISTTLGVQGSQISGDGYFSTSCVTPTGGGSVGGSLELTGQVDATGAFQLQTPSLDSVQITITGHVPTAAGVPWLAGYTLVGQGSATCVFNQSGSVMAQPLPDFTGTYTGSIASGKFPAGTSLSLQLTQGSLSIGRDANAYYPLTAAVTVTGSPCFTSGTTSATSIIPVMGTNILLPLTMSDGSQAFLNGFYPDLTGKTIVLQAFSVSGGNCNDYNINIRAATLTRQ